MTVINTFIFVSYWMLFRDIFLHRELVSRAKLCLVSVFPDIVKDCPKIRNLPKIFLRSFENVAADVNVSAPSLSAVSAYLPICSIFTFCAFSL